MKSLNYKKDRGRPLSRAIASHTRPIGLRPKRSGEQGYTIFALLAVMTIIAIMLMAAAPNVRHEAQREREKEAIFRGEEVAEAIYRYYRYTNRLPTSMEQLTEGVTVPGRTQKIQILRAAAARDPLSENGEWRLISPRSQAMLEFQRVLTLYAGGRLPNSTDPIRQQLQRQFTVQMTNVLNTGTTGTAPGGQESSPNSTGEFIGVASRSRNTSVITYYGIERHDEWVFTPLFR
jgi:type II secretory pathway pseudopilin PulG